MLLSDQILVLNPVDGRLTRSYLSSALIESPHISYPAAAHKIKMHWIIGSRDQ